MNQEDVTKPTQCNYCKHMSVYQLSTGSFCALCGAEGDKMERQYNEHGSYR